MRDVQLIQANSSDVEGILDIYNYAIAYTTATFDLEQQTISERMEWFQEIYGTYPIYVAKIDNLVVGYGLLGSFRKKEAYKHSAELSVYIHPDYQGRGIASLLISQLLKVAKDYEIKIIISVITAGNEASIQLHKKFNFTYQGRLNKVGYKFNQWLDVDFYQIEV